MLIAFYNVWVAITLALFYWGPIEWPGARDLDVALYVCLCVVSFDLAYLLSRKSSVTRFEGRKRWVPDSKRNARILIVAYAALTLLHLYVITGKSVISPASYSLDFGAVYADYGAALTNRSSTAAQQILTLAKAMTFPFALVAFIHHFRRDVFVVLGFLAPMAVSSLFRGTDKEVVDILLCLLVAMYCHRMLSWRAVLIMIAIPMAGALFVSRRIARFNGSLPACLPDSAACFDYQSFVGRTFGDSAEVFWVFTANYVTNGYQGLSYAFGLTWVPNFGMGHLPPLKRTLCTLSEGACSVGDYQTSLTMLGWDASARWTTVYPVLANDLTFWLVPAYTAFLGFAFGRCLRQWKALRDPRAGAAIVIITMFWIYSSANMQIAISMDWVIATLVLVYASPWMATHDSPRKRSQHPTARV